MPSTTPTIIYVDKHDSQSHGGDNEGTLDVVVKGKDNFVPFISPRHAFEATTQRCPSFNLNLGMQL
jgi:hypothetical protein